MRLHQKLRWRLSEVSYLVLDRFPHDIIIDGLHIDASLVSQIVEDVCSADSFRASLLVAKDEVDPLVQLTRHKFRLQGL